MLEQCTMLQYGATCCNTVRQLLLKQSAKRTASYRLRVVQACAQHMNRAIASHNFAAGISDRALKELYTLSMMQPAWIDAKYRIAQ
jgi:hypothetical protein